ncbi:MAG: DUF3616 domain-containing protein [Pseudomonadota bacterium]
MAGVQNIKLTFRERGSAVIDDLSAGALVGRTLFAAGDETAALEVLDRRGRNFSFRETVDLADLLPLPGGKDDEIDIEGLAADDRWLWVVGSHARTRPDVRDDGSGEALRKLRDVRREANRFLLARIPLVSTGGKSFGLARQDGSRRAEMIDAGRRSSAMMKWIEDDAILAPFADLPSKENGFDIEGIAADGEWVYLGLRGPVIRGYAVVLQFRITGSKRGALKARKLQGGRRFRKHMVWLDGLGTRDLMVSGEDLLMLAGPTMMAPGPGRIYRWKGALKAQDSGVVPEDDISLLKDLEPPAGEDKPEALVDLGNGRVMVLRDSPADTRLNRRTGTYQADVLTLG